MWKHLLSSLNKSKKVYFSQQIVLNIIHTIYLKLQEFNIRTVQKLQIFKQQSSRSFYLKCFNQEILGSQLYDYEKKNDYQFVNKLF